MNPETLLIYHHFRGWFEWKASTTTPTCFRDYIRETVEDYVSIKLPLDEPLLSSLLAESVERVDYDALTARYMEEVCDEVL